MYAPLYRLDWLTLSGRGYTDPSGIQWILMEETGFWDSPQPRTDIVERVNSHGSYMGPSYYQHRVVTIKGRAYASTARAMRTAWSQVSAIGSGPEQSLALSCDSEIGTLTCQVRRDDKVLTEPIRLLNKNTHAFEFSMQLVAPDPRKYAQAWREMRADLPQANSGDGLDFNTLQVMSTFRGLDFHGSPPGLRFGASNSTGFLQLTNEGTAPTAPLLTFYGPLTRPTLTATTGEVRSELRYNADLEAGQFIVIDPSNPSVLLNGTASRRHLLNPAEFAGFYIPGGTASAPGALRVGLTHEGGATTGGYATARFRSAWF